MQVELNINQIASLQRLKESLEHHTEFESPFTDDDAIFAIDDTDCTYEFPYDNGRVTIGDLRDLASILS